MPSTDAAAPRLLTIQQAARLVGRDSRTVRRWVLANPDWQVTIGHRVYVRTAFLEAALRRPESNEVAGS